ncbi:MAG: hypothetical protein ACRBCS_08880 [Cellvibrionaceae bacterium]
MKIKSLFAAIATFAAAQTFALAPTSSIDVELTLSGATAVDIQFTNYINQVCTAGTLDEYRQDSDVARVFTCTISNATVPGLSQANLNVMFRKASGGSSQGVGPVFNNATVPSIEIDPQLGGSCVNQSVGQWLCPDTNINVPAMVGVSDVEPDMFSIAANGGLTLSGPGWSANGSPQPVNVQTFGVVVTKDLRDALQTAQGLVTGSEEVSEMPTLSSAVIANLFSGSIPLWSSMKDASGNAITTNSPEVEVCLRAAGSGTQAQFNAFYMKNPCAYRGASSFTKLGLEVGSDCNNQNNDITQCGGFGGSAPPHIHWNNGSSDLGKCMTNVAAANRTAIGVQSIEKVGESRSDRNQFKYIRVNGVAPTLENVHAGLYQNVASASIQWNANIDANADRLALATGLRSTSQDVAAVQTFNTSLKVTPQNFPGFLENGVPADVGSLALVGLSGNNANVTTPFDAANPTSVYNQRLSDPISCSIPRINGDISVATQGTN